MLQKTFKMTRGPANRFIGLEIVRDREKKTLKIRQSAYVTKVLERFTMMGGNLVSTPIAGGQKLVKDVDQDGNILEAYNAPFRQLIGSIMYAAIGTRADIAFSFNQLSQFLQSPSKEHWMCAKRVLRYLRGTLDTGIVFSASCRSNHLVAYSDASWASEVESRKSVTGVCILTSGGEIGWRSEKQSLVADSTTYAEYVAAHSGTRDVVWLRWLLDDMDFKQDGPTVLHLDIVAAELLITNPADHERTKHFDIKFHYTREKFREGEINVQHVSTGDHVADIFTRALPVCKFEGFKKCLGMQ